MATKTKKVEKSEKKELKVVEPAVEEKKNFLHRAGDGLNSLSKKVPTGVKEGAKKAGKFIGGAALFVGGFALGVNFLEKLDSVETDVEEDSDSYTDDPVIEDPAPSNDDVDTDDASAED